MTVLNAFASAGDAEFLLWAGHATNARWVQFCLWGFLDEKKIQNRVTNNLKDERGGKHNPCLLHLHCQGRN